MPKNESDDIEVTQQDDETTEEVEETLDEEVEEEATEPENTTDQTDWEAEAKKYKAIADRNAKKKVVEKPEAPKAEGDLSTMDTIALIGAGVTNKEDINEVVDYSKLKGISIEEALESTVIKTILGEKAEYRKTAEATHTGKATRGSTKLSPEQILANAEKGKLPDDPEELAEALMQQKLNESKS